MQEQHRGHRGPAVAQHPSRALAYRAACPRQVGRRTGGSGCRAEAGMQCTGRAPAGCRQDADGHLELSSQQCQPILPSGDGGMGSQPLCDKPWTEARGAERRQPRPVGQPTGGGDEAVSSTDISPGESSSGGAPAGRGICRLQQSWGRRQLPDIQSAAVMLQCVRELCKHDVAALSCQQTD